MGISTSFPTSKPFCQFCLPNPSLPSVPVGATAAQACITSPCITSFCITSTLDYFKNLLSGCPASKLPTALQVNANLWYCPALKLAKIPYCLADEVHPSTHLAFNLPVFLALVPASREPGIL